MTGKKIIYKNDLSIAENARKNKCSEATIRRYIRLNNIDRKYDELYLKYKTLKELQAKHPEYTVYRIAKITGYSNATVKKYMAMDELYAKTCSDKLSTFDTSQKAAVVSSISKSQDEILSNILKLHIPSLEFDCDLTYSLGVFYRSLTPPQHRYDKFPITEGVRALDDAYLLPDGCFNSVVVDLPFIIKSSEKDREFSKVVQRFQCFTSKQELIDTNKEMLSLSYRLLKSGGILVMKLQNTNYAGQQIWTHYIVQEYAQQIGFELVDEFILEGKSRLLYESGVVQRHARKYHSYFLVFKKKRRRSKRKIKAIILDFDMTLFDTSASHQLRANRNKNWKAIYDTIPHFEMLEEWRVVFDTLHKKGINVAVVSDAQRELIERTVQHYDLNVDLIIGRQWHSRPKPNTKSTEIALEKLGVTSDAVIAFGDEQSDYETANKLGIKYYGCTWHGANTAAGNDTIQNPMEILTILNL